MNKDAYTYAELLHMGVSQLTSSPSAALDARVLLMAAAGIDEAMLIAKSREYPVADIRHVYLDMIDRRQAHEPIAYIIGYKDFWDQRYIVNQDVLIPRPDSEVLIETVLKYRSQIKTVLDLGVGSGCLLGTVLNLYPDAIGIGVDESLAATLLALRNMALIGVMDRSVIFQGRWLGAIRGPVDVVITNPPYIAQSDYNDLPADIRLYEPESALFAGQDGRQDYIAILRDIGRVLAPDGLTIVEIGDGHGEFLKNFAETLFPNANIVLERDLTGRDRALVVDQKAI